MEIMIGLFVVAGLFFLVFVALLRWVLRINDLVSRLEEIRELLSRRAKGE